MSWTNDTKPSVPTNMSVASGSGAIAKAAPVITIISVSPSPMLVATGTCGQKKTGMTDQAKARLPPSHKVARISAPPPCPAAREGARRRRMVTHTVPAIRSVDHDATCQNGIRG